MARWKVRLSIPAERDFADVVTYTTEHFGVRQSRIYEATLRKAFAALVAGPEVRGSVSREDLGAGLRTLHIARRGQRGRHLLVYREEPKQRIEVLRILHDAMDLGQHVGPSGDDEG